MFTIKRATAKISGSGIINEVVPFTMPSAKIEELLSYETFDDCMMEIEYDYNSYWYREPSGLTISTIAIFNDANEIMHYKSFELRCNKEMHSEIKNTLETMADFVDCGSLKSHFDEKSFIPGEFACTFKESSLIYDFLETVGGVAEWLLNYDVDNAEMEIREFVMKYADTLV